MVEGQPQSFTWVSMLIGRNTLKKGGKAQVAGLIAICAWRLFWQGSWQWHDNHWAFITGISDPVQAGLQMADLWDVTHEAEAQMEISAPEAQTELPIGLMI